MNAERRQTNEYTTAAVEHMKRSGATAGKGVEELTLSLSTLKGEIESLKREVGVFRTAPPRQNHCEGKADWSKRHGEG
ncbi:MAG: hypothetical protein ABSA46_00280 [Thermodesulfovibrionales bacterium]